MRETEIIKEVGEAIISWSLFNENYTVDRLDAKGIVIAAYSNNKKNEKFGISVKTRNVESNENNSIVLNQKDLIYTDEEAKLRELTPAFAFVVTSLKRIDILIVTYTYAFENWFAKGTCYENGDEVSDFIKRCKAADKCSKSVPISDKVRENWKNFEVGDGVIGVYSFERKLEK